MEQEEVKRLINRYLAGQCTENEKALVEEWYMQFEEDQPEVSKKHLAQLKAEIAGKLTNTN